MILFIDGIRVYLRQLSDSLRCKKSVNIDNPVLTNKCVKPVMHVIRFRTPSVLSETTSTSVNNTAPCLRISV